MPGPDSTKKVTQTLSSTSQQAPNDAAKVKMSTIEGFAIAAKAVKESLLRMQKAYDLRVGAAAQQQATTVITDIAKSSGPEAASAA